MVEGKIKMSGLNQQVGRFRTIDAFDLGQLRDEIARDRIRAVLTWRMKLGVVSGAEMQDCVRLLDLKDDRGADLNLS